MLHCRGGVRLFQGERECTPTSRKGRALLAVLAAEQRPLTRVRIIDLLWSDRQEEQARASLRTLLADLRSQHGRAFDRLLIVDRERVALGGGVRSDLDQPGAIARDGDLFEGLDHLDPELDDWLRVERDRRKQGPAAPSRAYDERITSPLPRLRVGHWVATAILLLVLLGAAYAWQNANA